MKLDWDAPLVIGERLMQTRMLEDLAGNNFSQAFVSRYVHDHACEETGRALLRVAREGRVAARDVTTGG